VLIARRWPVISLLTVALAAGQLAACRRDKPQDKSSAATVKKSPAELKQLADAAKTSLQGLDAPVAALRQRIQELHKEFDPLPPGLPEFGETRSEFYTTAEGVGMMSAKLRWLAQRLDAALQAGDAVELESVSKDIDKTYQEVKTADQISIGLIHKVQPFKKALEVRVEDVLGKGKCE
jgi:uncharacterized coiled-coil DUF342 family protein